jgi:SAM-dependent methyltransferase
MFPRLYHAHHCLHMEDLPFWLDIAAQRQDPILELGCGTGRVLARLAQAGRQIYGLDYDFGMLAVLRENLHPDLQNKGTVFQADFTRFRLAMLFDLILLPCNTFSTLDAAGRPALLSQVIAHLKPGGLFALSLPNPSMLRRLRPRSDPEVEEVLVHPLDGEPLQVSSAWQRTRQYFTLYWHYDHLLSDGRVERLSVETRHYLTSAETYLAEMRQAGFSSFNLYGDFDRSVLTPTSPNLIILATR